MNFNPILFVFAGMFFLMWMVSVSFGPSAADIQGSTTNNIISLSDEAASGLDLKVLPDLLAKASDAESLEAALNESNGANNLDLNDDGEVDYIKVTEFNESDPPPARYGFSLSTEVTENEEQEIAVIEITKEGESANVTVSGNEQIYGQERHYRSSHSLGTFLLMGYLLSPHRSFYSPYGYRSYPPSYRSTGVVGRSAYVNRAQKYQSTPVRSSTSGASVKSPNANKSASSIKQGLRNPSTTQRSFQTRNPSRAAASGAFGRSGTGSSTRGFGNRSTVRSFASSRRSFGGSFGK